jgi:hypothetical protein
MDPPRAVSCISEYDHAVPESGPERKASPVTVRVPELTDSSAEPDESDCDDTVGFSEAFLLFILIVFVPTSTCAASASTPAGSTVTIHTDPTLPWFTASESVTHAVSTSAPQSAASDPPTTTNAFVKGSTHADAITNPSSQH